MVEKKKGGDLLAKITHLLQVNFDFIHVLWVLYLYLVFFKKIGNIISPSSALFASKGLGCGVGGMLGGMLGGSSMRCVSQGDGGLVILIAGVDSLIRDEDIFAR